MRREALGSLPVKGGEIASCVRWIRDVVVYQAVRSSCERKMIDYVIGADHSCDSLEQRFTQFDSVVLHPEFSGMFHFTVLTVR